jgi:hypothetical protein
VLSVIRKYVVILRASLTCVAVITVIRFCAAMLIIEAQVKSYKWNTQSYDFNSSLLFQSRLKRPFGRGELVADILSFLGRFKNGRTSGNFWCQGYKTVLGVIMPPALYFLMILTEVTQIVTYLR